MKFNQVNKLARHLFEIKGKKLTAVRVFAHQLLLYFEKGRCEFYTKKGYNWGNIGSIYFCTINFSRARLSKRLLEQFEPAIRFTEEWIRNNFFGKIFLTAQYNMGHATKTLV